MGSYTIDDGKVSAKIGEEFDKMLELVGTASLLDSLQCVKEGGSVCMTGMVGNKWVLDTLVRCLGYRINLTTHAGGPYDFIATPQEDLEEQTNGGKLTVKIGKFLNLIRS